MIVAAGMAGKINLYSNIDHKCTTPLSPEELKATFYAPPDTTTIIDPITRAEHIRVVSRDFDFDGLNKYRLLESWTFDPATGVTTTHIDGIAPIRDVYIDVSTVSQQATFWAHYPDVSNIIARYDRKHPSNSLTQRLWSDYCSLPKNNGEQFATETVLQKKISRYYDLDPEDTNHRLQNIDDDSSLYNRIFYSVLGGNTPASDSLGSEWHFFDTPDTTVVYDPIARKDELKIVQHYPILDHRAKYRIDEEWSFNKVSGNFTISTSAVVPFAQLRNPVDNSPECWHIFWLKYKDFYPVLRQYEQVHPGMSLELNLWKDRLNNNK